MKLKKRLGKLLGNGFLRSAGILVGGTATAQALTVLVLPVLTRLYSPEDFALLAVYQAILAVLTVVACLRLEVAIPLPPDDNEAANLLILALISAGGMALLVGLFVMLFGQSFFASINQAQMYRFSWLLPIGVWAAASCAALQFWATRKKWFPAIARTRMMQAGSGLTVQLGFGLSGIGPVGLLLGHTLMAGAGLIYLGRKALLANAIALRVISPATAFKALSRYRRFPQYSTFEAFANNAAIQVPVILIAALAIGPEAGFVLLATRALGTPVALIGNAVAQVYLSRAPEELRNDSLPRFTADVLKGLSKVGVAPLVFLAVIAPSVFSLVFGEEWRRAGELVAWMTPWFVLKLLSSPVSMVMHVKMMQRTMLVLMIAGLAFRVIATMGAYTLDAAYIAEGYALSGMGFYLAALVVYLSASGVGWRVAYELARSTFLWSIMAIVAGLFALELTKSIGLP